MKEKIREFQKYLENEEKSRTTVEKYVRDVSRFLQFLGEKHLSKENLLFYKEKLCRCYAPASVNASLASLNSFFGFIGRYDLKMKSLKIQKKIFASSERELSKDEYETLVLAAKVRNQERLFLLLQTVCSTGIRISELSHITVETVDIGTAHIRCKGKYREVFLPSALCKMLKAYVKKKNINSGPVFITRSGKPLDRSNIWSDMKKLCRQTSVSEKKVFPHNLRHLFARTYYQMQNDIVRLADILGHSSIDTTRIYTMESGEIHRRQIEKLDFLDLKTDFSFGKEKRPRPGNRKERRKKK